MYADVYAILIANRSSTFCIVKKKWSKKCFQRKRQNLNLKVKFFQKFPRIPIKFH